jgi:hypothetical protein
MKSCNLSKHTDILIAPFYSTSMSLARAFSSEADAGSREENASNQVCRILFRFKLPESTFGSGFDVKKLRLLNLPGPSLHSRPYLVAAAPEAFCHSEGREQA